MLKRKHLMTGILISGVCTGLLTTNIVHASKQMMKNASHMVINTSESAPTILSEEKIQEQAEIAKDYLNEKAMDPKILEDGTKEFSLTASEFPWELYPGKIENAWGFNGQVPGPLLRLKVGDKVSIVVHNQLPQPTTLHLHGLAVPNSMDGVPYMEINGIKEGTQQPISHGDSFSYQFTVTPQMVGTHYYHTHVNDVYQEDMGLHGVLIVDPAGEQGPKYDVDALYELGSFKINGSEAENVFTMNGKACPEAPVLNVKQNQTVRIRLVNASAEESHVMHLHGYTFSIVALDGNPVARSQEANTVMLGPSQTTDIAFKATNPGQWMFHCHILDHTMNPPDVTDDEDSEMPYMGGLMTFINVQ